MRDAGARNLCARGRRRGKFEQRAEENAGQSACGGRRPRALRSAKGPENRSETGFKTGELL